MMTHPASTTIALACLVAAPGVAGPLHTPQQPEKPKPADHTLRDFDRFSADTQHALVRQLERKIQLDPNPAIQRIVSMQRTHGKLPLAREAPYHRAKDWADGVAPQRTYIVGGDERHTAVSKRFPVVSLLPDLQKSVWYDWGTGQIVRAAQPLSQRARMANLYHGYPPGSDDALARLLKKFDNDPKMRAVAHYFSHLYANLSAQVFEDVTLYEAWYSGTILAIPDVDAIPFERQILGTRRFKSPIPKGKKRTALYQKIRAQAFAYRKYRTLREAAAVAFLRADPQMDPTYKLLVPRFHYLYVVHDDDIDAVEQLLREVRDRSTLIAKVDARIEAAPAEYEKRLTRKMHLHDMYAWLHYWAQLVVYEQNKR